MLGSEMILGQMDRVTLAISPRSVAVAAYLHSGQLQIHSAPCQEKAATLGPEIYSRVGK